MSDIIGEITAAAGEQSDGIGQVNVAVNQLDQMTQQNAALVEESTAAAESLKDQANRLAQVIQIFRIDGAIQAVAHVPRPVLAPVSKLAPAVRASMPSPVRALSPAKLSNARKHPAPSAVARTDSQLVTPQPHKAPAAVGAEGDWESF